MYSVKLTPAGMLHLPIKCKKDRILIEAQRALFALQPLLKTTFEALESSEFPESTLVILSVKSHFGLKWSLIPAILYKGDSEGNGSGLTLINAAGEAFSSLPGAKILGAFEVYQVRKSAKGSSNYNLILTLKDIIDTAVKSGPQGVANA